MSFEMMELIGRVIHEWAVYHHLPICEHVERSLLESLALMLSPTLE